MIIQERVWAKCECCGGRGDLIQEESYGCDRCKKVIDRKLKNGETDFLEVTVFSTLDAGRGSTRYEYCSWECVFSDLKRISRGLTQQDFINLPYMVFGKQLNGMRPSDFWKAIKEYAYITG